MGYKILSEKLGGSLPQYSRLPQQEQDDVKLLPASRNTSHPSNIFQYIRFIVYSLTGIAFITSFLWVGPAALRSYLNAPSSSSSTSSTITNTSSPTISLIIASSTPNRNSTSWTKELKKDNLAIIEYNPPASSPKGLESLIYLKYIYEAYDNLSPISIFVDKWEKTKYTFPLSETDLINRLDLATVQSRGFLPFCFQDASSSGINDSIISLFYQHFPNDQMPDKFMALCGRFAVSRDAIRSVPREQYLHHANLLRRTCATSDAGKEWNVMWKYLFLHGDTTEVAASKSLCQSWGMCFDEGEWENLNGLWNDMEIAREKLELMEQLGKTFDLSEEIQALEHELKELRSVVESTRGINVRAYDIGTSEVASTEAQNPTTYNVAIEELLGEEQRLIAYTNVAQVGWAGIALSIAGCIYQNLGAHKLQKVFGDDLPLDIIRDALGGLRGKGLEGSEAVDGDVMKSALDAVVVMMGDVYWLVVWVGVICAVFGLGMKWERVILDPELEGSRRYSVSYEAIV